MCFQVIQYQLKNNLELIVIKEIVLKDVVLLYLFMREIEWIVILQTKNFRPQSKLQRSIPT